MQLFSTFVNKIFGDNFPYLPKCPRNKFFLSACSLFLKNQTFFSFFKINKNYYKKIFNPELFNKYKTYIQRVSDALSGWTWFGWRRAPLSIQRFTVGDFQWETDFLREKATRGIRERVEGWWGPFCWKNYFVQQTTVKSKGCNTPAVPVL